MPVARHEHTLRRMAEPTAAASQRSNRVRGGVLVFLGAFLALGGGWLLWWMLPTLLHPGVEIGGTAFNGSAQMASAVIAIIGSVFAFGVGAAAYGAWQVRTGQRNMKAVGALVGLAGLLFLLAFFITRSPGN